MKWQQNIAARREQRREFRRRHSLTEIRTEARKPLMEFYAEKFSFARFIREGGGE